MLKFMVYKSLVHPVLEYSSPVWGPLLSQALDTVQRRAAYWILSNYNWIYYVELSRMANFSQTSSFCQTINLLQNGSPLSTPQKQFFYPRTIRD